MCTGKPFLKDRPVGYKYMVLQDRLSLVTGSITLKCVTFCQEYMVLQNRWSRGGGLSTTGFTVGIMDRANEHREQSWLVLKSHRNAHQ